MNLQNVKGGYDYLPKEQRIRNYINDILRSTFECFGYAPIETPILCYYDILSDKYDEDNDILNEIYKLSDQGNRKLGLRYDLTVPFAKLIALNKNKISMPFKRYEIAKVFRDGPVKLGRDREFTQCDVDVVGVSGSLIEADLLMLYAEAFKKLDIDIIIKYNSRKLMTGIILSVGIKEKLVPTVTTLIDKIEKVSESEFVNLFTELEVSENQITKLLEYFKYSLDELNKEFAGTTNELIKEGLSELNELREYISFLGLESICSFTASLVRGQNYYTGNVFEVYAKDDFITCSIGGGGRYDKMVTDFINDGNKYPAVGISFGLSSIYEILKSRSMFENNTDIDIYIIPMNTNKESLKLASILRGYGYKVDLEMNSKKLRKSLDYANKENIPYVIILGENEVSNGYINLKDMLNNKEIRLDLKYLEDIKKIVKKANK